MRPRARAPLTWLLLQAAVGTRADNCADFAEELSLPNTTIQSAETVYAGTNLTLPEIDPSCDNSPQYIKADICRVVMHVTTSPTSGFTLESWLPFDWNGRFLGTGNGGLGGCIQYMDMTYGVNKGFATIATNNGHDGNKGTAFYKNPGVVEDFAYRALHTGVVIGKQVSKAFYEREPSKSYYLGCSTGGRQGLKAAQDFPDDFDGIVVGAPAVAFNNLTSWRAHFFPITGASGAPTYLSPETWELVYQDILRQCDGLDGYRDGIIEDPSLCHYRPEDLLCSPDSTENCLSKEQVGAVRDIFSPLYNDGSLVYPRMQPGISYSRLVSGVPFPYSVDWFRYVVHSDPEWDPATIGPEDYTKAAQLDPFNINTWNGNLSVVQNRGSKILHYHGLKDPMISSENSMRFYEHVSRTMNLRSDELDEFYRYFRISGLEHCFGGNGATYIGNYEKTVYEDGPEGNVLAAIVQWVEEGVAPDSILGTALATMTSRKVAFQRRHCRYPLRNKYRGVGDPSVPDSWECV